MNTSSNPAPPAETASGAPSISPAPAIPPAIVARMRAAMAAHRAGRLGEAAAGYGAVLAEHPDNADAGHLLGLIAYQEGRPADALEPVQQALTKNPVLAPAHNTLGLIKLALNDVAGAESAFRHALALRPSFAEAFVNLGNLVHRRGDREGALEFFRKAAAANPNYAEAAGYLGLVLSELSRHGEALPHLERAVGLSPGHPEMLTQLASALSALDRPEAEERFRQAIKAKADHVGALFGLGRLLAAKERTAEAVTFLQSAAAIDPAHAHAHLALARALAAENRNDEAKHAYLAATVADPRFVAAWLGLGHLCGILGQFDEALAHYFRVLEIDPLSQEALGAISQSRAAKLKPEDAARLETALGGTDLAAEKRASLHGNLAMYYDSSGAYDDAFRHLAAMNKIHHERLALTAEQYRAKPQQQRASLLTTLFDAEFFQRTQGFGDPSPVPVFVVGMPRSGTSLCEQILSSHSQIHGAGELAALGDISRSLPDLLMAAGVAGAANYPACMTDLTVDIARRVAADHIAHLHSLAPEAVRVVDKMPFNFMNLGLIATLFPKAKILHCRRNPADIALSCFQQNFAADMPWSVDLPSLGHYYREYDRLMRHWKDVLPIPILDVVYEEEVADLETWARRIVAFCGLEWEEACLRFFETERAVKTASQWQVRQPLYATSVGRWRNYQRHLGPLFEALGDLHRE